MTRPQSFDKEKVQLNLARLKKGGETFEVVIDSDKAILYKEGKDIDIRDILQGEKIFSDAKKGLLASENKMDAVFKTEDVLKIAEIIIDQGEIQLTAQYRDKVRDEKRKRIIDMIHRNGVDPRTGAPHPMARIENAFEEAKVKIDNFKKAEDQVGDILKMLRPVLPIKFELKEIEITLPAQYAGKAYPVITNFARIVRQDWLNDGSWKGLVEVPAGMQNDLFDSLNSLTQGNVETKVK